MKKAKTQTISKNNLQFITAIVLLLCSGTFFSWFSINTPFRQITNEVFENATQMRICFILALVFFIVGAIISVLISKNVSVRLRFILCALMLFTCFFSISMQIITFHFTNNYVLLYLSYAFLGGTASGIISVPVVGVLNSRLKRKRYITTIIVFGCILTGSLLIGNIIKALVDPETGDWRVVYTTIAIIIGTIVLISSFIIKPTYDPYRKSMKIEEDRI